MIATHHCADDSPPDAALTPPAEALPGGPDGAGPLPPPCPTGGGFGAMAAPRDVALGSSVRLVEAGRSSRDAAGSDADVKGMRAAGAPLARMSAMREAGGAAGPSESLASVVPWAAIAGAGGVNAGVGLGVGVGPASDGAEAVGAIVSDTTAGLESTTSAGAGSTVGAGV